MKSVSFKKAILLAMIGCLMASLFSGMTFSTAAATLTAGDYEYEITNKGKKYCTITDYNGSAKAVTIPTKLGGYTVTALGEDAFDSKKNLTSVIVPGSVKTIGEKAFNRCDNLSKIVLHEGVTTICEMAVYACWNLRHLSIPNSVKSFPDNALMFSRSAAIHGKEGSFIQQYYGGLRPFVLHQFSEKVVKPSCAKGYTVYTCECGLSEKGNYVEPSIAKHATVNIKAVKATKAKAGNTAGSYCKVCGEVFEQSKAVAKIKTIALSATTLVYTGKTRKPKLTITDANGKAISTTNYTAKFPTQSKNVGKYTVKVTFKGNYSGTAQLTYQIIPKGTAIKKITRTASGFRLEWKKQASQTTGYQIQYAKKKSFSDAKTVTVSKASTLKKTITKLENGKTYYLRIRTYKNAKASGKTVKVGSNWSAAVKVGYAKKSGKFYKQTEKAPSVVNEILDELRITYREQSCSSSSIEFWVRLTKKYSGYYPYKITVYRATSKNGTYKKINPTCYEFGHELFSIHDKNVSANKQYFYKIEAVYVPNDCYDSDDFKKLSATEKIYDETLAPEGYYTAMKTLREYSTSGSTLKWKKVKGASGYLVCETVVEKLGYNIFGMPVYGHSDADQATTKTSVKSRVKAHYPAMRGGSVFYYVCPYVKRNGYYYCDGKKVAKKLDYSKDISFKKRAGQ